MHSDADTNVRLSKLLAGEDHEQVAREGLDHLERYLPIRFDAPPSWLTSAIDQARQLGREGNTHAARTVVQNLAQGGQAVEFGRYREHVTWAEAENARKLSALAWMWATLRDASRTDVALDKRLEQLERFAHDHFAVSELRTERGWAERQTRAEYLLPRGWRAA